MLYLEQRDPASFFQTKLHAICVNYMYMYMYMYHEHTCTLYVCTCMYYIHVCRCTYIHVHTLHVQCIYLLNYVEEELHYFQQQMVSFLYIYMYMYVLRLYIHVHVQSNIIHTFTCTKSAVQKERRCKPWTALSGFWPSSAGCSTIFPWHALLGLNNPWEA